MRDDAPSATANIVARNVVLVAHTQRLALLVPDEAARLSSQFVAAFSTEGQAFVRMSTKRWFQTLQRLYERLTIPGLALHQALRKRYIERVVRVSLSEGFEQLVVLGGGLDSLALRLHLEFPGVNFIELDHPATQRIKQSVMNRRRDTGLNLKLLPVDFRKQGLEETLNACPDYRAQRRTVFISEGVLMYLEACEVDNIFDFVRSTLGAPRRIIFTFMETDGKGRASFRRSTWLVRLWLSLRGEPFKWGLQGKEIESFLREREFALKEMATSETFRETYLRDYGLQDSLLAEGENVCVADKAEGRGLIH